MGVLSQIDRSNFEFRTPYYWTTISLSASADELIKDILEVIKKEVNIKLEQMTAAKELKRTLKANKYIHKVDNVLPDVESNRVPYQKLKKLPMRFICCDRAKYTLLWPGHTSFGITKPNRSRSIIYEKQNVKYQITLQVTMGFMSLGPNFDRPAISIYESIANNNWKCAYNFRTHKLVCYEVGLKLLLTHKIITLIL
ncbi:hypothetical protein PHYBLDRAFT_165028 [Phycomyces blakesleeanus NRRL 1555(-)]|uniref:Uncharacterized protein n=1 Tax=Phycomyces blakesleeanus (strain ATCC 8743b / DSM 1359 / FGSC 10004 / NBRC 33097 / NRRL 1555) TaxID=763407 RepID=A0A162UIQ5_PHYB8|nr:hypothetical protein PHYBLDRAFT_165028 [Phycomyces blakesleeanus NRRL 1555(-)]OAD76502.1 hypothetical protein PHYBLDRAFT_165028 [Phycomyces blakesleeanus NRRL 1555(-)]|eukprot:XP_018294542.1 hypothetical protein PHYBLDRAFT_165028 [Phycomyces blakesleeanus NRRL 1555(-)]